MTAPMVDPGVYLDFQGLNRLKAEAGRDSPGAVAQAARQFEALFLQMMLKSMRKATEGLGHGLLDNDQTRFYQGLADQQLALSMSRNSGLGLAKLLVEQLGGHHADKVQPGAVSGAGISLLRASVRKGLPLHRQQQRAFPLGPQVRTPGTVATDVPAGSPPEGGPSSGPAAFVHKVWPLAQTAAAALGVSPVVLLAQAALETGWGSAVIHHPNGLSSHNLFGIKAGSGWSGPSVGVSTVEYQDGTAVRRVEPFRAYGSYAESFADYVHLLKQSPRYQQALASGGDPVAFATALQEAGYATDPNYAAKLQGVLGGATLRDALSSLKETDGRPLI
ncbi:MAG: flagellar rod assembly protein/muramidase FlgJ [Chromatiales bacterium 21-64-14]|nr:MAG: flagellar rod assembly protein/muramidase FlgJ [Chromatiales bacterium 21-64-14]HQU15100.1 flagellar assembly peptidoglycan hydrolase FlgJ [Gammaproteobacteria bacterium]